MFFFSFVSLLGFGWNVKFFFPLGLILQFEIIGYLDRLMFIDQER